MRARLTILVVLALLLSVPVLADSVYLRSGKVLKGTVVREHPDKIELKLPSGEIKTIPRDDIAMIHKGVSKTEEYRKRLKAVDEKDLNALLDLAEWCQEQNLRRQRVSVLRKALKIDPDCAEARRGLLERWGGSKWVKDREKGKVPPPTLASEREFPKIGLKLRPIADWKVDDRGEKGLVLSGPDRYRCPVTLEILPLTGTPTKHLAKDAGWSEPVAFEHGPLKGLAAERDERDGDKRLRVREIAVLGNGWSLRFRLRCLKVEFDDWRPHLDLLVSKVVVLAPKLDFKHAKLGIGFCFPQDDKWEVGVGLPNQEGTPLVGIVFLNYKPSERGALDYCRMTYFQTRGWRGHPRRGALRRGSDLQVDASPRQPRGRSGGTRPA
jgi:hypothetical protein